MTLQIFETNIAILHISSVADFKPNTFENSVVFVHLIFSVLHSIFWNWYVCEKVWLKLLLVICGKCNFIRMASASCRDNSQATNKQSASSDEDYRCSCCCPALVCISVIRAIVNPESPNFNRLEGKDEEMAANDSGTSWPVHLFLNSKFCTKFAGQVQHSSWARCFWASERHLRRPGRIRFRHL